MTPGHLPGEPPSPEAVAACLGQSPGAPREYEVQETFNLVAADGTWPWREGIPMDIPVVDGARLLVLDPPPREQTWSSARAFAGMAAELQLERRLSDDGVNLDGERVARGAPVAGDTRTSTRSRRSGTGGNGPDTQTL